MQLRSLWRQAGIDGQPSVRVRTVSGDAVELVAEDRTEPGDQVVESRGITIRADAAACSVLGDGLLDLDGEAFVVRPRMPS